MALYDTGVVQEPFREVIEMSDGYGGGQTPAPVVQKSSNRVVWIVLGSLIGLIFLTLGTCIVFKDDLANMAIATSVEAIRAEVVADSTLQFDRAQYSELVNQFKERLKAGKHEDATVLVFMQSMQSWYQDQKIDQSEIEASAKAMIQFFPDLASYWQPAEPAPTESIEPEVPADSTAMPVDSAAIDSSSGQ